MRGEREAAGFTLVEIMIVVAIVALLAAITLPNFVRSRATSRQSACINNLRLVAAAKDQAGLELGMLETDSPTTADLYPYLKYTPLINGLPKEPENGTYTIGPISTDPTCSVGGGHKL